MRKTMTKEVTKTTVKVAKMVVVDGQPKAEPLEDIVLLGNVSLEKAQKAVNKKFDYAVTVFEVKPETVVYQMNVEDFIKHATIKTDDEADEQESE